MAFTAESCLVAPKRRPTNSLAPIRHFDGGFVRAERRSLHTGRCVVGQSGSACFTVGMRMTGAGTKHERCPGEVGMGRCGSVGFVRAFSGVPGTASNDVFGIVFAVCPRIQVGLGGFSMPGDDRERAAAFRPKKDFGTSLLDELSKIWGEPRLSRTLRSYNTDAAPAGGLLLGHTRFILARRPPPQDQRQTHGGIDAEVVAVPSYSFSVADREVLQSLGVSAGVASKNGGFTQGQKAYLKYHRREVFLAATVASGQTRA